MLHDKRAWVVLSRLGSLRTSQRTVMCPTYRRTARTNASIDTRSLGGAVAQLGARLDGIEEVVGSNPIGSTNFQKTHVSGRSNLIANLLSNKGHETTFEGNTRRTTSRCAPRLLVRGLAVDVHRGTDVRVAMSSCRVFVGAPVSPRRVRNVWRDVCQPTRPTPQRMSAGRCGRRSDSR
jgi:hypothetical protein